MGLNPAGFSAAINAARQGARTLLLEQTGQLGGVSTTGMMSHWTGHTSGGFYRELLERSKGIQLSDTSEYDELTKIINTEELKLVMFEMSQEASVELRLYSFACRAITEENVVKGVVIESKSGREALMARIVIDASGDGDIAASAGAEFYKGREYDQKMQPMTIMFKVKNVDTDRVHFIGAFEDTYIMKNGEDLQTFSHQNIRYPAGHTLIYRSDSKGVVTLNMTNAIQVDGTRSEDLTRAEITCRGQIRPILKFLRENIEGFEAAELMSSASAIGVRETRHFIGEETLTEYDILEARLFDNWAVVNVHFNFDIHNLDGAGLDETGVQKKFKQHRGYSIPYGAFLPKKVENLMLAGRCISGTHMAHSSYRVMPICANMGQSVGIAAALCCKENISPRQLDVKKLQSRLRELGVIP